MRQSVNRCKERLPQRFSGSDSRMNAEYQRLEAEASVVEAELRDWG
ncbi:hypothetical protein [Schlesneria sp. DSM 10557]